MSHAERVIFVVPAVILVALPLLFWLVEFLWLPAGLGSEVPFHLIMALSLWLYIPGSIFGKPWFESDDFGYLPRGLAGWLITILFYVAVSLLLSFLLRLFLCARRRI